MLANRSQRGTKGDTSILIVNDLGWQDFCAFYFGERGYEICLIHRWDIGAHRHGSLFLFGYAVNGRGGLIGRLPVSRVLVDPAFNSFIVIDSLCFLASFHFLPGDGRMLFLRSITGFGM